MNIEKPSFLNSVDIGILVKGPDRGLDRRIWSKETLQLAPRQDSTACDFYSNPAAAGGGNTAPDRPSPIFSLPNLRFDTRSGIPEDHVMRFPDPAAITGRPDHW